MVKCTGDESGPRDHLVAAAHKYEVEPFTKALFPTQTSNPCSELLESTTVSLTNGFALMLCKAASMSNLKAP